MDPFSEALERGEEMLWEGRPDKAAFATWRRRQDRQVSIALLLALAACTALLFPSSHFIAVAAFFIVSPIVALAATSRADPEVERSIIWYAVTNKRLLFTLLLDGSIEVYGIRLTRVRRVRLMKKHIEAPTDGTGTLAFTVLGFTQTSNIFQTIANADDVKLLIEDIIRGSSRR